ncbi:TMV resistance protein N [Glycine soja]|uniref:TMV resistance protein N n=1 Tax=Glycine soja TaxID=3848 RepID=A0A0B2NXU4_GLYSO|nr:TMV resistance protein N [Glycine soja]
MSNNKDYLNWTYYPFECLSSSFESDKLVELNMSHSNIKQLWEDTKPLPNLRRLNLSSKILIKLPYIGDALYLESLDLEGCIQLEEIGLSIVLLRMLTFLNLKDCKSLIKLPQFGEDLILGLLVLKRCKQLRQIDPSIGLLKELTYLNLKYCKNLLLYEQRDPEHLKKIDIDATPTHFQPTSSYSREYKKSVNGLMPSSPIFPCMGKLDLSFCNLVEIPDAIGIICCLERLDLSGDNLVTLPNLKKLSKLFCLKLQHCKQLKSLPELPSRIDFSGVWYVGRDTGLYMFNCPELVDREGCTNIGFSWMIQISQVLQVPVNCIGSVTPESEIPRWFNNQHEGNCVSLDASTVMHDDSWIGVAF